MAKIDFSIGNKTELGRLIADSPLTATEFPYEADGLTICFDGKVQDVVLLIEASQEYLDYIAYLEGCYPLPAGAVYGLSKVSVQQYSGTPKRNVFCDFTDAVQLISKNNPVNVVGLGNTSILVVGGKKNYGKALKPVEVITEDGDCVTCNDIKGQLVAGDVTLEGKELNAGQIDFCVTCFIAPAEEG